MSTDQDALAYHSEGRPGKLEVVPTKRLQTQRDLSLAYSPGVAAPCRAIHANPGDVFKYTNKGNLVGVVTNGTAVLGLGNIGPLAGKPVMEGKANLFKKFADIDVFDIELDAKTPDEVVAAVKAMAPTFGGINLEDIKAPECFEIERRLQDLCDIPVFHDDQHGTAIISSAALINACEITNRTLDNLRIVFSGAGAAALGCARLYRMLGVRRENIVMFDKDGLIHVDRDDLFPEVREFATTRRYKGLDDALDGADAFLGLSVANILTPAMLQHMAPRPILFPMANPDPEIPYELARKARPDAILATGRSDQPNQVNNVLGFPFVFRGALDCRASKITDGMKLAAVRALARLAREDVPDEVLRAYGLQSLHFGPDYIIPKPFDPRVLMWVAPAVANAAAVDGVAREPIADLDHYKETLHKLIVRSRGLMQPLIQRVRSQPPRTIVFPDGSNPKVLRAAQFCVEERLCRPLLLGPEWKIQKRAEAVNVSLVGCEIEEPGPNERFELLAEGLWKARARKGMTLTSARALLHDPIYYGCMLVDQGLADGLVGGLGLPYRHTLRPALRVIGRDRRNGIVSGVYAMIFRDRHIFFGDCTVNVEPTPEELAEIALNTAQTAEIFGVKPRVALLSYSDFGEHAKDKQVRRVQAALELVRKKRPDLEIDGEMQADTAVNWDKLEANFPFSALTGPANVLVFPDLTSGNIAYKLLSNLTGVEALGPLLMGLEGPVNVIPVHASVNEIANIATYTATQALARAGL